jgi:hypothetical protein
VARRGFDEPPSTRDPRCGGNMATCRDGLYLAVTSQNDVKIFFYVVSKIRFKHSFSSASVA